MIDAPPPTPPAHVSHMVDVKPPEFELQRGTTANPFPSTLEFARVDVHNVVISHFGRFLMPAEPAGDAFFGLELGTNGSGPAARRALITPDGYRWLRYDSRPARGLELVPTADDSAANPWDVRGRW